MTDWLASLQREFCQGVVGHPDGDRRWVIQTPFLYEDGDVLPVVVREEADGWVLTDDGLAVSHLYFDDFEYTEARHRRLAVIAEAAGATLADAGQLTMPLDGPPDATEVADFIQLVAQVQGLARSTPERDQNRYLTQVRADLIPKLTTPNFERNWTPPEVAARWKGNYRADLRIGVDNRPPVAIFAASTSERVIVAALSVNHYRALEVDARPVLAYHPDRVTSEAINRFQDEVEDDNAVIPTRPGSISPLVARLARLGVPIAG